MEVKSGPESWRLRTVCSSRREPRGSASAGLAHVRRCPEALYSKAMRMQTRPFPVLAAIVGRLVIFVVSVHGFAQPASERLFYGFEVVFNASPHDFGYFNQATYVANSLRLFRLDAQLEYLATRGLSLHADVRSDNLDAPDANGLYLRYRPFSSRAVAIQAGRVPPILGGFARRRYNSDNPLIGYPLAYQYPTLIRSEASVGSIEELVGFRGRGGRLRYPIGEEEVEAGLPMIDALRWDTGVQLHLGEDSVDPVSVQIAVTQGVASDPRVGDNNSGKQISGRVGIRPAFYLTLGGSLAVGDYVSDALIAQLDDVARPSSELNRKTDKKQRFGAVDVEFSRGPWQLRSEFIYSSWDSPALGVALSARSVYGELRRTLYPGLHVAARLGRMDYSDVAHDGQQVSWDSPVTRLETGIGYRIQRHWQVKVSYQFNTRDAGRLSRRHLPNFQLYFWW